MIPDDIAAALEPPGGDPAQQLAFERHRREDFIVGRDPVARHEEERGAADDDIADLAPVHGQAVRFRLAQGIEAGRDEGLEVASRHAPRSARVADTREMRP